MLLLGQSVLFLIIYQYATGLINHERQCNGTICTLFCRWQKSGGSGSSNTPNVTWTKYVNGSYVWLSPKNESVININVTVRYPNNYNQKQDPHVTGVLVIKPGPYGGYGWYMCNISGETQILSINRNMTVSVFNDSTVCCGNSNCTYAGNATLQWYANSTYLGWTTGNKTTYANNSISNYTIVGNGCNGCLNGIWPYDTIIECIQTYLDANGIGKFPAKGFLVQNPPTVSYPTSLTTFRVTPVGTEHVAILVVALVVSGCILLTCIICCTVYCLRKEAVRRQQYSGYTAGAA
uniref:GP121.4 n=1 Tax=Caviid herpesvirus 2 str. CIDMTR TaxID=1415526 RepID=U6HC69_9BETA|nr:GP121.4 [Caviid herpesvirus 2 str. CIDMTR]